MKSALAYQVAKAGKELKRDVEARLLANQIAVQGNSTLASETAGIEAWIKTNQSAGGLGAAPTLSNTTYVGSFGEGEVSEWRHLRTYRSPRALPAHAPGVLVARRLGHRA